MHYIMVLYISKYNIKEKRHLYIINPNANPGFNDLPEWMIHKAELVELLRNVLTTF